MRTLSQAAIDTLSSNYAVKPLVIVKIYWDNPVVYGEKTNVDFDVKGKLLTLSDIDDVINLDGSSNSISLSIELDDTDYSLKEIFNNKNINGVKVDILQWFENFSLSDAFLIFQGEIASPIVYKEKAKTLSFDVINRIQDNEIGFSIEEGNFTYVPAGTVGRMWPLSFGTVSSVPALQIAEPPAGIMAEGTGIVIDAAWDQEINAMRLEGARAHSNMLDEFTRGLQEAYLAANERRDTQTSDEPFGSRIANSHDTAAQQHFRQADQYRADEIQITQNIIAKEQEQRDQGQYQTSAVRIVTSNLPQNTMLTLKAGDAIFTGSLSGNIFHISSRDVPIQVNNAPSPTLKTNTDSLASFETPETRDKFYWIDGGTQIQALNFPLKYIVGMDHLTVLNVKAKQRGVYVKVPQNYYTITQETFTNNLKVTTLLLSEPLTSKNNETTFWENNDLFIDVVSPVSSNIVDAMVYLITSFTNLQYDVTSFEAVKVQVANYPANFVLTERSNVIQTLTDIAFQSRCQIWVNDRKFYLRYLPAKLTQIDTITVSDIVETDDSNVEITTTQSEEIVTKFVALWKADQTQSESFEITYRNNVANFGVKEQRYNFYIYNNIESVKKSAEFWSIQKSNLWKRLTFSTFLQKIKIESFDPILIDIGTIVSNTPVVGVVEKAVYDSQRNLIDLEVKLPVRFGEMDEFIFSAPKDVAEKYPDLGDPAIKTGNPLNGATGDITNGLLIREGIVGLNTLVYRGLFAGRDKQIGDQFDNPSDFNNSGTILDPEEVLATRPVNLERFNNVKRYDVKPPLPVVIPTESGTSCYPGYVGTRISTRLYNVQIYLEGLQQPPVTVTVEQFEHPDNDIITVGTPCMVFSGKGTLETTKYLMLVPLWMRADE